MLAFIEMNVQMPWRTWAGVHTEGTDGSHSEEAW